MIKSYSKKGRLFGLVSLLVILIIFSTMVFAISLFCIEKCGSREGAYEFCYGDDVIGFCNCRNINPDELVRKDTTNAYTSMYCRYNPITGSDDYMKMEMKCHGEPDATFRIDRKIKTCSGPCCDFDGEPICVPVKITEEGEKPEEYQWYSNFLEDAHCCSKGEFCCGATSCCSINNEICRWRGPYNRDAKCCPKDLTIADCNSGYWDRDCYWDSNDYICGEPYYVFVCSNTFCCSFVC